MKLLASSAALLATLAACQTVPPGPALDSAVHIRWDTEPAIRAKGLQPDTVYTLVLETPAYWDKDVTRRSETPYRSDARGRIDTDAQAPEGEDERSAHRPLRTLSTVREPLDGVSMSNARIRLLDADGTEVARRAVAFGPDRSQLSETPLGEAFDGAFVLSREGAGPQPAIVVLGGSEGGDSAARGAAPRYAAEGFTVLGLPYHAPDWTGEGSAFPGLPSAFAHLDIAYLEAAVAALRERDDVKAGSVQLVGVSKGGEYVLLAGSLIPDSSVGGGFCGIVANVPSDVVWEGWGSAELDAPYSGFAYKGEPLPFVPYANIARGINPNDPYTLAQSHADGRAANPDRVEAARIRVENIDEPVLMTGGGADTVWPSGDMVRNIAVTREAAGLPTESFVADGAGHGLSGTPLRRGTVADTAARLESYPATLAFLKRNARRADCRDAG